MITTILVLEIFFLFQCSSEMVICVEFHPLDESVIVTCGKGNTFHFISCCGCVDHIGLVP